MGGRDLCPIKWAIFKRNYYCDFENQTWFIKSK